jgi:hypothetical protein
LDVAPKKISQIDGTSPVFQIFKPSHCIPEWWILHVDPRFQASFLGESGVPWPCGIGGTAHVFNACTSMGRQRICCAEQQLITWSPSEIGPDPKSAYEAYGFSRLWLHSSIQWSAGLVTQSICLQFAKNWAPVACCQRIFAAASVFCALPAIKG